MKKNNLKNYEKIIAFLPKAMKDFAINDKDTKADILEQNLDQEEIQSLVVTNMHYENMKNKQKITISVPLRTLQNIKLQASRKGMPYQTFVNSLLYQYGTGQLVEKNI